MREDKIFAERTVTRENDVPLRKYLIVCEGEKTEPVYFRAIRSRKRELNLNPLIEIVPIIRSFSEEGWSNPQKIVKRLVRNLKEDELGELSYETILNRVMSYLKKEKLISKTQMQEKRLGKFSIVL